jgi:hypothetical protein
MWEDLVRSESGHNEKVVENNPLVGWGEAAEGLPALFNLPLVLFSKLGNKIYLLT